MAADADSGSAWSAAGSSAGSAAGRSTGASPPRPLPWPEVRAALLAQWARTVQSVSLVPLDRYGDPTRLGCWRVSELVAHLAHSPQATVVALLGPPPDRAELDAVGWLAGTARGAHLIDALVRGDAEGVAPADLAQALADVVGVASAALGEAGLLPTQVVTSRQAPMTLADFATTRCVEGVVHHLDLAAAVPDLGLPAPDPAALRVVVRLLASGLVVAAPGRSVELRVPGRSGVAVQCVPGPRHTRGTPPGVVEADPVAWVEVATGRLPWPEAVATGRVRASGERADLSPYLPLLG